MRVNQHHRIMRLRASPRRQAYREARNVVVFFLFLFLLYLSF